MQGNFRRGRRRCDRAGTETWQGKLLIQQCLFLETSNSVFQFCFKVHSWEVSVADQAPCSAEGKGPDRAHSWSKQQRAAAILSSLLPRLNLCNSLLSWALSVPLGLWKLLQLSRERRAGLAHCCTESLFYHKGVLLDTLCFGGLKSGCLELVI